jgi:autoinducer 2-degrading protein
MLSLIVILRPLRWSDRRTCLKIAWAGLRLPSRIGSHRLPPARFARHAGVVLVVHVHVSVQPDQVEEFLAATDRNARASLDEPGVLRFDVLQDQADPTHVVLVEVYRDADAAAAHKETAHYAAWRDSVAALMAKPRESVKFAAVFPAADDQWAAQR